MTSKGVRASALAGPSASEEARPAFRSVRESEGCSDDEKASSMVAYSACVRALASLAFASCKLAGATGAERAAGTSAAKVGVAAGGAAWGFVSAGARSVAAVKARMKAARAPRAVLRRLPNRETKGAFTPRPPRP